MHFRSAYRLNEFPWNMWSRNWILLRSNWTCTVWIGRIMTSRLQTTITGLMKTIPSVEEVGVYLIYHVVARSQWIWLPWVSILCCVDSSGRVWMQPWMFLSNEPDQRNRPTAIAKRQFVGRTLASVALLSEHKGHTIKQGDTMNQPLRIHRKIPLSCKMCTFQMDL